MKRTALVTGSAALLLTLAAACGSSSGGGSAPTSTPTSPSSSAPAPAASATITITNFVFTGPLTVSPGATVAVTNTDSASHTVTADNGTFDVPAPAGQTVTFTAPTKAGTYTYFCTIHPTMHGTLIVK
jgi:plastocyanin